MSGILAALAGKAVGKVTAAGASQTLDSVGNAAIKIRSALTGDLPPEEKVKVILAQLETIESQASVIVAEANGQSWLQRNWRPITMMVIVAIVANNYLIFPYVSMFTDKVVVLELPDKLFTLMTLGLSGYIVGRTVEKIRR